MLQARSEERVSEGQTERGGAEAQHCTHSAQCPCSPLVSQQQPLAPRTRPAICHHGEVRCLSADERCEIRTTAGNLR